MREKYDPKIKYYYIFAIVTGFIILLSHFVANMAMVVLLFSFLFGILSIATLIYFVQREYDKKLFLVPIYYLACFIAYYSIDKGFSIFGGNTALLDKIYILVGITLSVAIIAGSTFILGKYKR